MAITRALLSDLDHLRQTEVQTVTGFPIADQLGPTNLQTVGIFKRRLRLYNSLKVIPSQEVDSEEGEGHNIDLSPSHSAIDLSTPELQSNAEFSSPEPRTMRKKTKVDYRKLHSGK